MHDQEDTSLSQISKGVKKITKGLEQLKYSDHDFAQDQLDQTIENLESKKIPIDQASQSTGKDRTTNRAMIVNALNTLPDCKGAKSEIVALVEQEMGGPLSKQAM